MSTALADIELYVEARNVPPATKSHKKPDLYLTLAVCPTDISNESDTKNNATTSGKSSSPLRVLKTIKKFETHTASWPQPFRLGVDRNVLGHAQVQVLDAHITLQSDTIIGSLDVPLAGAVASLYERVSALNRHHQNASNNSTDDVDRCSDFDALHSPLKLTLLLVLQPGVNPLPSGAASEGTSPPPTVTLLLKPIFSHNRLELTEKEMEEHFTKINSTYFENDTKAAGESASRPIELSESVERSTTTSATLPLTAPIADLSHDSTNPSAARQTAPAILAPPLNGLYRIRTYHGTFMSVQPDKPLASAVPSTAVGNFERFEVRGPTEEEMKRYVALKVEQRKVSASSIWETISNSSSTNSSPQHSEVNRNFSSYTYRSDSWTAVSDVGGKAPDPSSLFTSAASVPSFSIKDPKSDGSLFPIVVIRSLPMGTFLGLTDTNQLRVGPQASAWEMFTLRPHPRLRPAGKFWMLHSEFFETNVAAVSTAHGASPSQDFNAIQTASEWCGFELLPSTDSYSRNSANGAEISADGVASSSKLFTPASTSVSFVASLHAQPASPGIYTIAARSANVRLAIALAGPVTAGPTTPQDILAIKLIPLSADQCGGRTVGCFALQGAASGTFLGLEKKRLYAAGKACAWEAWEVLPHPSEPLHHTLRSISFGKYLCVDPAGGTSLRVSDKPGPWEAFYLGDPVH